MDLGSKLVLTALAQIAFVKFASFGVNKFYVCNFYVIFPFA